MMLITIYLRVCVVRKKVWSMTLKDACVLRSRLRRTVLAFRSHGREFTSNFEGKGFRRCDEMLTRGSQILASFFDIFLEKRWGAESSPVVVFSCAETTCASIYEQQG